MRFLIATFLGMSGFFVHADTMNHYMNISNQIPQMEMKADPQAQAWARSARSIMIITNESIAETLTQANELAKAQGKPLFCLPANTTLNAATMGGLILQAYRENSSQQSDKDRMTVSQMAWVGVTKAYPCQAQANTFAVQQMQHISGR